MGRRPFKLKRLGPRDRLYPDYSDPIALISPRISGLFVKFIYTPGVADWDPSPSDSKPVNPSLQVVPRQSLANLFLQTFPLQLFERWADYTTPDVVNEDERPHGVKACRRNINTGEHDPCSSPELSCFAIFVANLFHGQFASALPWRSCSSDMILGSWEAWWETLPSKKPSAYDLHFILTHDRNRPRT